MDPERNVPKRSQFWFTQSYSDDTDYKIFGLITVVCSILLAIFGFILFSPIVSQINFEEAFVTPLAPYLIKIFEYGGFEANVTIRFLFLVSFMASAIGVYLFARELTRRQITPILASILYLIPPVPIFIFSFYKSDLYVSEIESAKSFLTIIYGDGAHFLALAILPFAAIFFIRFLRLGLNSDLVIAVVLCALILLANSFQALILIII